MSAYSCGIDNPAQDSLTACGLSQNTLHAAVKQLDQQAIQDDCPHLQIGANPQGVLCRDCRKQWTGARAEEIWRALNPDRGELRQQGAEKPRLKLDSYYEWRVEVARKIVSEADGVGGDLSIMLAVIDSLLDQADVDIPATNYNALTAQVRADTFRVGPLPKWVQRQQLTEKEKA